MIYTLELYIDALTKKVFEASQIFPSTHLLHFIEYDLQDMIQVNSIDIIELHRYEDFLIKRRFKYHEEESYSYECYLIFAKYKNGYLKNVVSCDICSTVHYVFFVNHKQYELPICDVDDITLKKFNQLINYHTSLYTLMRS